MFPFIDNLPTYKIGLNSFTRKRKMGFEDIAILSLRNSKKSLQIGINEFIKEFKEQKSKYTKSSYTKARAKVSPSLFTALNDELIESYYEDKEGVELYNGFRVFAIDGSTLQLPNIESISPKIDGKTQKMSNDLRDIYGYISNNLSDYETKARISILEDVENRITHQGVINSYFSSEKDGVKKSNDYKVYYLKKKEYIHYFVAVLNSSVFYWFWRVMFDGYHCGKANIASFPFDPQKVSGSVSEKLNEVVENLMDNYKANSIRKLVNYKGSGKVEYDEFYLNKSKPIIDEIDKVLAKHYGFTDEELDFIINYDIKYRMGIH